MNDEKFMRCNWSKIASQENLEEISPATKKMLTAMQLLNLLLITVPQEYSFIVVLFVLFPKKWYITANIEVTDIV